VGTLFHDSLEISFQGFSLEFIRSGAGLRRDLLDRIRDEILWVAVRSRGWTDDSTYEHFRRWFHIEPLYETNALMLVRHAGQLVGLAGAVNNWRVDNRSLIHLCSIGLLPEAQARGLIPAMMGVLWEVSLQDKQVREDFENRRAFITAITQNAYLIAYLHKIFELYPGPDVRPDAEIRSVSRAVVERFCPELPIEEETLVLRGEANYGYRRTPYSTNRKINAFCDSQLRYDKGDTFVVVGRVVPDRLQPYRALLWARYHEVLSALGFSPIGPERPQVVPPSERLGCD
jgi:hypothetical protein